MPTYEYRCPQGHVFEKFFPQMTKSRRRRCPTCGKLAERLISGGGGLVFKGSGFYATDYKRSGAPPAETDGKSETKSEPKADAKPEAKPDAKPDKPKSKKKDA
jgi:putative FmdB family regulatory protein